MEAGSLEMVELLVAAGADVDAKADLYDGLNAVRLAQKLGRTDIAEYLLGLENERQAIQPSEVTTRGPKGQTNSP